MKRFSGQLFGLISLVLFSSFSFSAGDGQSYYGGVDVFGTKSEQVSPSDIVETTRSYLARSRLTLKSQRALSFDDAGHGKRIYMGVSSAEDWDWEWGYIDFGKVSGKYVGPYSNGDVSMKTDIKSEGWFLHFQFSPEIYENLEATLKLGVLRWDGSKFARYTLDQANDTTVIRDNYETIAGIDEYFGAGLLYTVNERWKIRLDANRYMLKDDKMDTLGIAAQFWFSGRLINNIFDY